MSKMNSISTREAAKNTGFTDKLFLCRKATILATRFWQLLFEPVWESFLQAVPVITALHDLFSAWNSQKAPATKANRFIPAGAAAEDISSGSSEPMRCITEHKLLLNI